MIARTASSFHAMKFGCVGRVIKLIRIALVAENPVIRRSKCMVRTL